MYSKYLPNIVFPSTYTAWTKKEGNHQETNSPAHSLGLFGFLLLPPTRGTLRTRPGRIFCREAPKPLMGQERCEALKLTFLLSVCFATWQVNPLLFAAPLADGLSGIILCLSQKDVQKYLMPSGCKWCADTFLVNSLVSRPQTTVESLHQLHQIPSVDVAPPGTRHVELILMVALWYHQASPALLYQPWQQGKRR